MDFILPELCYNHRVVLSKQPFLTLNHRKDDRCEKILKSFFAAGLNTAIYEE